MRPEPARPDLEVEQRPVRPHARADVQAERSVVGGAERQPLPGTLEDRVEQRSTGTALVRIRVDEQVRHDPDVAAAQVRS